MPPATYAEIHPEGDRNPNVVPEGGYVMPPDVAYQMLNPEPMWLKVSLPRTSPELDELRAEVKAMHVTLNSMSALLWQLVLNAQGIDISLLPNDGTNILSANGVSIKE